MSRTAGPPHREPATLCRPAPRSAPATAALIAVLVAGGCGGGPPTEAAVGHDTASLDSLGPLRGHIVVDSVDRAWFRYAGGGPFFLCGPGDPEGFLYRGERRDDGTREGDQLEIVEKLGRTGANSLYVAAVRSHGGDGDRWENPFVAGRPELGLNDAVLDQWDGWIAALEERGVVVFFILYDDTADPWKTGDRVGDGERRFLRTLVNRLEDRRNLIWAVAEEYQEALSRERVSRIAELIAEYDDRDHPVAVHQLPGTTFDFPDDPHVDQFAAQVRFGSGVEAFHDELVEAFEQADGRYNLTMAEGQPAHGSQTPERTRELNWAAAMAGAYVMVLGWDVAGTAEAALEGCGHLAGFMERTPLARLDPHDELALGGTRWVLADPDSAFVLYGSAEEGPVGLRDLPAGRYAALWMDVVDGTTAEASMDLAGDRLLEAPPGIGPELALSLRRSGDAP